MTDPRVAPQAARFGDLADRYERARPLYPEAALSELSARCGLRFGTSVIDLGAGTGKLTRQVAALGADVVAVEPAAGMRLRFEAEVPGVPVLDGTAEDIRLDDASVEIVTVGQAFHWFDTRRALYEIARVLRPVLERLRRFLDTHPETAGRRRLTHTRPCTLHLCQRSG